MKIPADDNLIRLAGFVSGDITEGDLSDDDMRQLEYHGLSALVAARVSANSTYKPLIDRRALMAANESIRLASLRELFDALSTSIGNRYLIFKGTALAYSIYSEPWLRPRTDTDLLIIESDVEQISTVFTGLGFERQMAIDGTLISYQCTFSKQLAGASTLNIDVHWRISNRQCLANSLTFSELIKQASPASRLHERAPTPSHAHSLLLACIHRLGHHHTEERLAWLHDIHLLAESLPETEWHECLKLATTKKLSALVRDGLMSAQTYFNTQIPELVWATLARSNTSNEPSAIFLDRSLKPWKILISDLKALPSMSLKLRFLKETVFPTSDYIKQHMGTRSVIVGYFKRALFGAQKLFKP